MEKLSAPPIATKSPNQDFIKLRMVGRFLGNLHRSLGLLENGVRCFSQLDPYEAPTGFSVSRGDFPKLKDTVVETRETLERLFQATDSMALLENPSPMVLPPDRNPGEIRLIAKRIQSGFTGCRNAMKKLLEYDSRFLKKGVTETSLGQQCLTRLATLSTVISHMEFITPEEATKAVKTMKSASPDIPIVPRDTRKPTTKPLAPAKAEALRKQFEESKALSGHELARDLAREICMKMEDSGRGIPFGELQELFGLSTHDLKTELKFLRLLVEPFHVTLVGSFAPKGRPFIAFEAPDQPETPAQA